MRRAALPLLAALAALVPAGAGGGPAAVDSCAIHERPVGWGHRAHAGRRVVDTVVLHSSYDALGPEPYDLDGLLEEYRQYDVAPHFVIDRAGGIWRTVPENDVAWHAGRSRMPDGRTGANGFSIGVELMTTRTDSVTASQYAALNALLACLAREHPIRHVVRHSDIAPGRKDDPWNFDPSRLLLPVPR